MNFLKLFEKNFIVAAHRGARSIAPENTMTSLKMSVGYCDFIEVDVQLSSDGVCVIMHDDTLSRTTNVFKLDKYNSRKPYRVSDFTYKELKELDYGSWFDGQYEPLLTLEDALKFVKEKSLFINVEIKDISDSFSDERVVSSVMEIIKTLEVEDRVLISSFRHEYLLICKKTLPKIATAALVEDEHPANLISYLKELKVDVYNMENELVDRKILKQLKDAGFFVNVYTVNSKARQRKLFQMGVNGVFSDILM